MSSPFGPILLIANPRAGRGRGAVLPRLTAALNERGLTHDAVLTERPHHAEELARAAAMANSPTFVVAVGGDGTVHEVVNGLIDAESGKPHDPDAVFGAVGGGSGCDFIRTFGIDRAPEIAARHLDGDALYPLDVGRVRYVEDGVDKVRLFANIAEVGWGAEVTRRANGWPRWLGASRYGLAAIASALTMHRTQTSVEIDHTTHDERISEVVVANCQFFGGGVHVAPRALPDDGTFNVQTWAAHARDVLTAMPSTRNGEHLSRPDVREWQSSTVKVTAEQPLLIEADGEVLGTTPAQFDLLDQVLRLKI